MIASLTTWFSRKWQTQEPDALRTAYQVTFSGPHGQQVLQHLIDTIYCQVYEGTDAQAALVFNARRAVIHDILYNIDVATRPQHYTLTQGDPHGER